MSFTGRANSSAYWKRSKLPSAGGKYIACIECFYPTIAAKTNIFFVCSFVFTSIQAQFL